MKRCWRASAAAAVLSSTAWAAQAPPPDFAAFRAKFVAAVKAKDLKAVAALTAFPLANATYGEPDSLSESAFMKRSRDLYAVFAGCLATQPATLDPPPKNGERSWAIDCDGQVFHFAQRGGAWRYVKQENINE